MNNTKLTLNFITNGKRIYSKKYLFTMTYNKWNHIAITADSYALKSYKNGRLITDLVLEGWHIF